MSERINPFAGLADPPAFTTKPKAEKLVEEATINKLAEQNNFPSRQVQKPAKVERKKARVYRTGRNQQFNAKLTAETLSKIYKLADEKSVPLGELLRLAVEALSREESRQKESSAAVQVETRAKMIGAGSPQISIRSEDE